MLERFERFNETTSRWAESIGFGAVVFMVALTVVDVVGTKTMRLPVPGSLDMMALAQLIAISFAAAMTLIRGRHVSVEFFVMLLPRRARALVDCAVQLLCLALFAVIVWRLFEVGYFQQTGNEVTPTIRIPLAPFPYLAALAMVPVCLVFAQRFLSSLLSLVGDER